MLQEKTEEYPHYWTYEKQKSLIIQEEINATHAYIGVPKSRLERWHCIEALEDWNVPLG